MSEFLNATSTYHCYRFRSWYRIQSAAVMIMILTYIIYICLMWQVFQQWTRLNGKKWFTIRTCTQLCCQNFVQGIWLSDVSAIFVVLYRWEENVLIKNISKVYSVFDFFDLCLWVGKSSKFSKVHRLILQRTEHTYPLTVSSRPIYQNFRAAVLCLYDIQERQIYRKKGEI